jgi:hypothetical protein
VNSPAAVPLPRLLALTAAVLAGHLWLLRAAPGSVQVAGPKKHTFVTRSVDASRPQPAAEPEPPPARLPPESSRAAAPRRRAGLVNAAAAAAAAAPPVVTAQTPARRAARTLEPLSYALAAPARLHYQVSASVRGQDRLANSELVWRHDGESYEASLAIGGGLPARTQRSTGRITAEGLAPLRFSDKARSEEATHFRHDQGKVSFSSNRPDAHLLAGAQDRLSVLLQLGAMIAANPGNFPPGTEIAIQTAGTRDAQPWLFLVAGAEELLLPGGAVKAIKLTRNPLKEYDQKVELWLAPTMDYVPVRLRLTQPNGDSLDQQWASTDRD